MYNRHTRANLIFHTIDHTQDVVRRVQEISAHYELADVEVTELTVAAWFHDTGHLFTEPSKHEEKSVELAEEFLRNRAEDDSFIAGVAGLIRATKYPPSPQTLPEMIICDADTYHFGLDAFRKTNKQVREEFVLRKVNPPVLDWNKNTLELLTKHQFYTSYCKDLLNAGKEKNMKRPKKKLDRHDAASNSTQTLGEHGKGAAGTDKQKTALITKGIQTMLRLTSQNHLELSNMADGKASILISVNAIIISVILSVLIRRLEAETYLKFPTIVFLASSLATIVIAILATRPKVSEGSFSREDILNKKTNLLFFGNFYRSKLEEYKWAMNTMMRDPDYLYGSVIQDIYHLGVVLGRKYKLIRLAYTVFMVGIFLSVIAFILAVVLHQPQQAIISSPAVSPF